MSHFHAPAAPALHALPDTVLQLQGMVQELQRTREEVLGQIDGQIARVTRLLGHFRERQPSMPPETPKLTSVLMTAPNAGSLDPELEQATLAELNQALSLAFKEIAGRGGMLRAVE